MSNQHELKKLLDVNLETAQVIVSNDVIWVNDEKRCLLRATCKNIHLDDQRVIQEERYLQLNDYLKEFGTVLAHESDDGYDGWEYVLLTKYGAYGLLAWSYGTCGRCDNIQWANENEDFELVLREILCSIQWFVTKEEMLQHLESDDFRRYGDGYHKFVKAVKEL